MSSRARELLERARAADKLDGAASQRISESVLEKLARGESPLPGIDVSPVVLPKLSWWSALFSSSGLKSIVLLSAGIASVATFAALRTQPAHEPTLVVQDARVEASAPTPVVSAVEPTSEVKPEPAVAAEAPVARRHEASTRAGPASKRESGGGHRLRTKVKSEAESTRALRVSAASADSHALEPASTTPTPMAAIPDRAAPKVAAASGQLDAELGLLRRAYSALQAGKPADAQALLDEHSERYPHGSLEEPREVAHMIVLCKMGRDRAARVRAESFLALHPKSPFVPRVRSICTDSKD